MRSARFMLAPAVVFLVGCSNGDAGAPDAAADVPVTNDAGAGADVGVVSVPLLHCAAGVELASNVTIGTQQFNLLLDTGSAVVIAGGYTPSDSATDTQKPDSSNYGGGAKFSGEIYTDTMGFAPSLLAPMNFTAIKTETGIYLPNCGPANVNSSGVLGLAYAGSGDPGTDLFIDRLVATTGIANTFAVQMCDSGGTLWLGGFDPTATTAAPQYTPFVKDDAYYVVTLASIGVASTTVPIAAGGYTTTMIDTGTSENYFAPAVVSAITAAIAASPGGQQLFGGDGGTPLDLAGKCYALTQTKTELDTILPPLTLTFGAGATAITVQALPSESYLESVQGQWCGTLVGVSTSSLGFAGLIGEPLLRSNVFVFDRGAQQLGVAPHAACP
jgi:hypothetical protein